MDLADDAPQVADSRRRRHSTSARGGATCRFSSGMVCRAGRCAGSHNGPGGRRPSEERRAGGPSCPASCRPAPRDAGHATSARMPLPSSSSRSVSDNARVACFDAAQAPTAGATIFENNDPTITMRLRGRSPWASVGNAMAVAPRDRHSAATASRLSTLRAASTSRTGLRSASRSAVARPTPLDAPVMTMTGVLTGGERDRADHLRARARDAACSHQRPGRRTGR